LVDGFEHGEEEGEADAACYASSGHVSASSVLKCDWISVTNIDPTPKMHISPAFCALGICSLTTMGIGKTSSKISVIMFNTTVAMYKGVRSIQLPSVIIISQFLRIGVHAKMSENMIMPTVLTQMLAASPDLWGCKISTM
jgi:hypothetical protein